MHSKSKGIRAALGAALAAGLLAGCFGGGGGSDDSDVNLKPAFVGTVTKSSYDGASDDLLTAGLGKSGLQGAAPAPANTTAPTAAELRRLAIYNNYRALVDVASAGGYGTLYGPNIDASGQNTGGEGKIAGNEYLAYADDGSGNKNVTMMVQVPATFSRSQPCIVTATSSGSRGVYGAIGTAGEWGLKRGCAVAYSDKGSGNGVHDLASNTVNLQNGTRTTATTAGKNSNFTSLAGNALANFNASNPNRIAVKHAHSQQNPERDWGTDTLNAIRFAFYVLNEERGEKNPDGSTRRIYRPDNTIVIASSVSNGAGAALAAAEQDSEGLIDGVAVSEPSIQLAPGGNLKVQRGSTTLAGTGRPLYDYFTFANLYQPCATLSTRAVGSPAQALVPTAQATNRCAGLRAKGLLTSTTVAQQAEESMDLLLAAGWQPETVSLHASHSALAVLPVTMAYANAYGRFSVADDLCGYSYAGTDASGAPAPLAAASLAQIFGTGNGVPPSSGIQIINDNNPSGPINNALSISPSTGVNDLNLDGAICLRNLWTGTDANAVRVQNGVKETYRTADLKGKPAIIVHGRSDTLVPPAFTSRVYFGQNRVVEDGKSQLTYVEVTNGQHFDAFIDALAGYDARFVPVHVYFNQALDMMWARLTQNKPLPPSQVVRTTPRGGTAGAAPALTSANVPPISYNPPPSDVITFSNNTVVIPD